MNHTLERLQKETAVIIPFQYLLRLIEENKENP